MKAPHPPTLVPHMHTQPRIQLSKLIVVHNLHVPLVQTTLLVHNLGTVPDLDYIKWLQYIYCDDYSGQTSCTYAIYIILIVQIIYWTLFANSKKCYKIHAHLRLKHEVQGKLHDRNDKPCYSLMITAVFSSSLNLKPLPLLFLSATKTQSKLRPLIWLNHQRSQWR